MMQAFEAKLHRPEGTGTWTYVTAPFNVETVFGTRGRVPVTGTIDDHPFRGSLMPHSSGQHILVVKKEIRDQINKHSGATVRVALKLDEAPRVASLSEEFIAVLQEHPDAEAIFKQLSYSRQKEFAEWIGSAKKSATRERRALKAIDLILSGTRLKS